MYNHKLKTFIAVVDSGSFSKAAKKLYISNVSVMNQINSLERELNLKLLERTSTGVVPTRIGTSIYKKSLLMIEESDSFLSEFRENTNSIIKLGFLKKTIIQNLCTF